MSRMGHHAINTVFYFFGKDVLIFLIPKNLQAKGNIIFPVTSPTECVFSTLALWWRPKDHLQGSVLFPAMWVLDIQLGVRL